MLGGDVEIPSRFHRWIQQARQFVLRNSRYLLSIAASVVLTVVLLVVPVNYEAMGDYGYLGVFLSTLLPSATVIFPSPTLAAAFIAGTFLNPFWVGVVAGLGATLGELTGYLAGYSGSGLMARSPHYERVRQVVERFGWWTIFVFALIPNPLFDLAGIAAGAMRLPLWAFQLICFAGKTIRFVLIAYLGWWV